MTPQDPTDLATTPAYVAPSEPIAAQAPTPTKSGIFLGRYGLRAGWGIPIYLLLSILLGSVFSILTLAATGRLKPVIQKAIAQRQAAQAGHPAVVTPKAPQAEMTPRNAAIGEGLQFAALLLVALLMTKIEHRRFGVYGIGRHGIRNILPGAFWGLASLSLLVLILRSDHLLVFDHRALYGGTAILFGLKWLLVFFLVGCLEEYLFRGYVQFALTRGFVGLAEKISPTHTRALAFLFASVITSVVFFCAHLGNGGENGWGLFMVFLAGVVFTYALWRTGSLWWGIGFHMTWDWAQSFLYGVPDSGGLSAGRLFQTHPTGSVQLSGGADGPEGSLFVIPVLLLVMVILRFTRAGTQPPLEQTVPEAVPPQQALPETHTLVA